MNDMICVDKSIILSIFMGLWSLLAYCIGYWAGKGDKKDK